jgi:hypothetical protein
MPQAVSKYVDIRTSPIEDRIDAMNELVEAGYEVHANFSPVIMYGDKQWKKDWIELWGLMDSKLTDRAKLQMKSEVIFLTHSTDLHDIIRTWVTQDAYKVLKYTSIKEYQYYNNSMKRIIITGGSGLVGTGIRSISHRYNKYEFVNISSIEYDLTSMEKTREMFETYKPYYVIHLAACVGGLFKNMSDKVKMLEDNLMINFNVVKCSHECKVENW